jgi:hypothetical protein
MSNPQITVADYFMGRDITHGLMLSPDMRLEAARTVDLVNRFLARVPPGAVTWHINPRTGNILSSGWRPPDINARTPGAAPRSKHIMCRAADLYDPEGDIDEWCMSAEGLRVLAEIGLWLEQPAATKGWCHVQSVPPGSGNRVFYP